MVNDINENERSKRIENRRKKSNEKTGKHRNSMRTFFVMFKEDQKKENEVATLILVQQNASGGSLFIQTMLSEICVARACVCVCVDVIK